MWKTVVSLGWLFTVPILLTAAFGQALDIGGDTDIAVEVTADRQGCAGPACVRLSVQARNLSPQYRFVSHDLLDVTRLRLTANDEDLLLVPHTGSRRSQIQERLGPRGGPQDRLIRTYRIPGCCTVQAGTGQLDSLPPGSYVVTYEPTSDARGDPEASRVHVQASSTRFTIDGPRTTRAEP